MARLRQTAGMKRTLSLTLAAMLVLAAGYLWLAALDGAMRQRMRHELADVAPTVLDLMGLDLPPEMTGRSLIVR